MAVNFEALLFDMDGTLIDSEHLYISHIKERVRALGKEFPDSLLLSQVGKDLRTTAPKAIGVLGLDMTVDEYITFLDLPSMFQKLDDLSLMPGVQKTLDAFHGRLPMAIATGSPPEFIQAVMEKFRLRPYFKAAVSSRGLPAGKPAPDVYLEAAKALGAEPSRCIAVDDAPAGITSAKAAGAYALAAASPWTKHLSFAGADHLCYSMDEARSHMEEIL